MRSRAFNVADAKHSGNQYEQVAQIQVRLNKGVSGIVDPVQIDGPVAERLGDLDECYTEWIQSGVAVSDEIVAEVDRIINS